MTLELLGEPLRRYRAVDTSDSDAFGHAFTTIYGGRRFESASGQFQIRGNFAQLDDIALGYLSGSGSLAVEFPEMPVARLQLALSGQSVTRSGGGE